MAALPKATTTCRFDGDVFEITINQTGPITTAMQRQIRVIYLDVLQAQDTSNDDLTNAELQKIMEDNWPSAVTPIVSTSAWSATITFNQNTAGTPITGQFNSATGTVRALEYRFPAPADTDGYQTVVRLANSNLAGKNVGALARVFVS